MTETEKPPDPLDSLWKKAYEASARGDVPGTMFVWKSLAEKGVWSAYARIAEVYERGADGVPKDVGQALSWYRKAVFEGDDPIAHLGLGRAHYNGTGVERDLALALKHFQRAHAYNLPQAGIYLGLMYYRGDVVEKDVRKAKQHFAVAAAAEFVSAYAYLARIALGEGRLLRAVKLLLKAMALGVKIMKEDPLDPRLLGFK